MTGLLLTSVVALAGNIPLGYWRAGARRLSWQWLVAIHLAVPIIVALRIVFGLSYAYIPIFVALAVLGQLAGGMFKRRGQLRVQGRNPESDAAIR